MVAFGHPMPGGNMHRLTLVLKQKNPACLFQRSAGDDGLGCIRAVAAIIIMNVAFALVCLGVWAIWHFLL